MLAKDKDFIYYEGDCAGGLINPFTPTNVDNPTIASFMSKPLKVGTISQDICCKPSKDFVKLFQGVPKETAEILLGAQAQFHELIENKTFEKFAEVARPLYKVIAEDMIRQHNRLGGTFAVA